MNQAQRWCVAGGWCAQTQQLVQIQYKYIQIPNVRGLLPQKVGCRKSNAGILVSTPSFAPAAPGCGFIFHAVAATPERRFSQIWDGSRCFALGVFPKGTVRNFPAPSQSVYK